VRFRKAQWVATPIKDINGHLAAIRGIFMEDAIAKSSACRALAIAQRGKAFHFCVLGAIVLGDRFSRCCG
jgi:hypothetical protein